jgi:hypothetical protein
MFQTQGRAEKLRRHTFLNTCPIYVIISLKPLFDLEKLSDIL